MYVIRVTDQFSSAHRLLDYQGKCENMHGHNWKVEAAVRGDTLQKNGLLVDFTILKRALKSVLDGLDHATLNELPELRGVNPTSENLARFIYGKLAAHPELAGCAVAGVSVWESDRCCATYSE